MSGFTMFEKNAGKKPMPRGSLWNLFKEQKGKQKCRQKKKKKPVCLQKNKNQCSDVATAISSTRDDRAMFKQLRTCNL